jgi:hypothetical protein
MPPAGYFFIDKKVTKKSGPTEIYLSSLGNCEKKHFSSEFLRLLPIGKFQNADFLILKIFVHFVVNN